MAQRDSSSVCRYWAVIFAFHAVILNAVLHAVSLTLSEQRESKGKDPAFVVACPSLL
jgi:hypothetical protein